MAAILFDLDGTLTDPREGICACIRYALESLGAPVPPEAELLRCIGPPLDGSFARLLATEDAAITREAVRLYRERFSDVGIFENAVYDGIPEALAMLSAAGHDLFVATSKPHVYARRIVDRYGLGEFRGIYGSEMDGTRSDKGELIAYALGREGLAPDSAVMIGDRLHDVVGASCAGIACVGVTYGYGSVEELRDAAVLCPSPSEIPASVSRVLGQANLFGG